MATITEDYVSFETAKLLKEKGFDIETEHEMWYVIKQFSTGCHWNSCTYKVGDITREYDDDCCISMPTHQMAMKWLREVHKLYIEITPSSKTNEFIVDSYRIDIVTKTFDTLYVSSGYDTYEQACEAAIKYCLEHLI